MLQQLERKEIQKKREIEIKIKIKRKKRERERHRKIKECVIERYRDTDKKGGKRERLREGERGKEGDEEQ